MIALSLVLITPQHPYPHSLFLHLREPEHHAPWTLPTSPLFRPKQQQRIKRQSHGSWNSTVIRSHFQALLVSVFQLRAEIKNVPIWFRPILFLSSVRKVIGGMTAVRFPGGTRAFLSKPGQQLSKFPIRLVLGILSLEVKRLEREFYFHLVYRLRIRCALPQLPQ
jgi:hypothetical protein